MKIDWHSLKKEGYPPEIGLYLVTVEGGLEGEIEGLDLKLGERASDIAYYSGGRGWKLRVGPYYVKAWAKLPEAYQGV